MTRETKIGLLVGLGFVIVIGILLSDQLSKSTQPPPAPISVVGSNVRSGVAAATGTVAAPAQPQTTPVNPGSTMQTPRDLARQPQNVVQIGGPDSVAPPVGHWADQSSGLVRAFPNDLQLGNGQSSSVRSAPAGQTYTAKSGDSLSRIAAHFYGSDTPSNRALIVKANPSLAANPDLIKVGKTYTIPPAPTAAPASATPAQLPAPAPDTVADAGPRSPAAPSGHVYTVKRGDTLWDIAEDEVGSSAAVAAIEDLNKDVLHGGTGLRVGMQLRLPSQASSLN